MPRRDVRMYLYDIAEAARLIQEFTQGRSLQEYTADVLLRSAVERQFGIIGEALVQARRTSPELCSRLSDVQQIIDFRNRLSHGDSDVAHDVVWNAIEQSLPVLATEVEALMRELMRSVETGLRGGSGTACRRCHVCDSPLRAVTTDLPFKVSDDALVILKAMPVLQCSGCREYVIEDPVMARVEVILRQAGTAAELQIVRYAA
jgi:YgiT-type zinc finger domain-containing protein